MHEASHPEAAVDARIDDLAGEVDDMKNTLRVLLQEVRTLKPPLTPHESSEVGNTGLEEFHPRQWLHRQ